MTVDVTESEITREHTATVTIGFENVGDEPLNIAAGRGFPFTTTESEDFRWGLVPSADAGTRESPDCWVPEDSSHAFAYPPTRDIYEILPGERRTAERWLWSHYEAEVCMPTGVTSFRTHGHIGPPGEMDRIEWGFDLEISPE